MSKLTSKEFNELQRWIEVRDLSQQAKAYIRQATDYANGHNYDYVEANNASKFLDKLENKAMEKIKQFIEV